MTARGTGFLRSIQAKLSLLIVALVVTMAAFFSFSSAARQAHELEASLVRKAETYGRLLSRQLQPAVAFADRETAREIFDSSAADADLVAAVLVGPSGQPIEARGSLDGPLPSTTVATLTVEDQGARIRVVAPVISQEGPRGALALELSKAAVVAAAAQARWLALIWGGIGALVGLAAALLIARSFARRVGALARTAGAVAAGDLAQPAVVDRSGDEIGALASAFNGMLETINRLVGQIQETARQEGARLERLVAQRTTDLRRVLEHVEQGLLVVDREAAIGPERSAVADRWFGSSATGQRLWDWLLPDDDDSERRRWFATSWQSLIDGDLTVEICLDQLPREIERHGQIFELAYTAIPGVTEVDGVLVVISDVTSDRARERADMHQRELAAAVGRYYRDRSGWLEFMAESRALVAGIGAEVTDELQVARALHTLKGNCALFGLASIAELAHATEDQLSEDGRLDASKLTREWSSLEQRLAILGDGASGRLDVELARFDALVGQIEAGAPHRRLMRLARLCRYQPVALRLERLAEAARPLAARLGKEIAAIDIDDHGLYLPVRGLTEFWASAIHVVRNAIDHGCETGAERVARGKPAGARLTMSAAVRDGEFVVEIGDDGAGIDWQRLQEKAAASGRKPESEPELIELLLRGGISTRDAITDVSGRGIGLGAVRDACERCGGRVEVVSHAGAGTMIQFRWPSAIVEVIDSSLYERATLRSLSARPVAGPEHEHAATHVNGTQIVGNAGA